MRTFPARPAGLCLGALLTASVTGATGILVSPAQMGLVVKPGESATGVFHVSASRAEKTRVRIRVVDFEKTPEGETVEVKEGTARRSCLGWARVEPLAFETAESGWTDVRISVTVPREVSGTYWALAIFQVEPETGRPGAGRTVSFRTQLQVPLLVTVAGTEARSARVENLKAVAGPDGTVEVSADVSNTGNTGLQPTGSWVVERKAEPSEQKEEVQEKELASFLLLPGQSYRAHDRLAAPGFAPRDLSVHLYVVYGVETGQVAEATASVEAGPPERTPGPAKAPPPKPARRKDGAPRP